MDNEQLEQTLKKLCASGKCLMSNIDNEIHKDVEKYLKENPFQVADYAGWNFHSDVWYDDISKKFNVLVMVYHCCQGIWEFDTPEEIMKFCCDKWGDD